VVFVARGSHASSETGDVPLREADLTAGTPNPRRHPMWWGIGFGVLVYLVIAFTLGLMTLRKGHWVMFIIGIFIPIFWLVGALIPPARAAEAV